MNDYWISVNDKLPPTNTNVLFCNNIIDEIHIGHLPNKFKESMGCVEFIIEFHYGQTEAIFATHWMDLPSLPKQVTTTI